MMPPRIGGPPRWTPERAAELARRWNDDQPIERIAAYLGVTTTSVSSVVSVLRRKYPNLGLRYRQRGSV